MNLLITHKTNCILGGIIRRFLLAVLLFLLLQAGAAGILMQTERSTCNAMLLSTGANVLFIILAWKWLKIFDLRHAFAFKDTFSSRNGYAVTAGLIGAVCCVLFCDMLTELLQLPDQNEAMFREILSNPAGIVSVGIIAPIFEELIFREGIEGFLLNHSHGYWRAILISAALFGIIHWNPAQSFFAFVMGVTLGILYWKTRNIWLCGLVHILNNGTAIISMRMTEEGASDMTFSELLGGTAIVATIIFMLFILSWMTLNYFCRQYK